MIFHDHEVESPTGNINARVIVVRITVPPASTLRHAHPPPPPSPSLLPQHYQMIKEKIITMTEMTGWHMKQKYAL